MQIDFLFHARMITLISLLMVVDAVFFGLALESILRRGPDMILVFAFEVYFIQPKNSNS